MFTWRNKGEFKDLAKARLDKCYANEVCTATFSEATIIAQAIIYSDHSALVHYTYHSFERGVPYFKTKPY